MVNLGNKLKELRTGARMTQAEVAARINISKAMVSSYELSSRAPSYEILVKLAALFHVSTDYLLGIQTHSHISVDGLTPSQVALVKSLIRELRRTGAAE